MLDGEMGSSLPEAAKPMFRTMLDLLAVLNSKIGELDKEMARRAREDVIARRLMTIPGVGPITATAITALAPPAETFAKGRDFAAWLSLVPPALDWWQAKAGGNPYVQQQLDLMAPDGRLVFIAGHQGATAEVNIRDLVRRRLTLTGSTLRPRPAACKGGIARALVGAVWPLLEDKRMVTRIHAVFPLEEVRRAHALLDANEQLGKVVLAVSADHAEERPDQRPT